MTFFSETALVLTEQAYQKLLHEIAAITKPYLQSNVIELLSKAEIYRYPRENTIFFYWRCVYWQYQGFIAMDEVIFLQDFLLDLNDKEYRFLRIEGGGWKYFGGSLMSHYSPRSFIAISKWIDKDDCEEIIYPAALVSNDTGIDCPV